MSINIDYFFGTRFSAPPIVFFEISKRCNAKCRMCDVWREKNSKELSFDSKIRLIKEFKKVGVQCVPIYGGEPFMSKDLFGVLDEIYRQGMTSTVTTNGTLLSEGNVRRAYESGLRHIIVSIDSHTALGHDYLRGRKGTFAEAVNGIKLIKEKYPKMIVSVNTIVSKYNVSETGSIIRFVKSLGADAINFLPHHMVYPQSLHDSQDEKLALDAEALEIFRKEIVKSQKIINSFSEQSMSGRFIKGIYDMKSRNVRCYSGYMFAEVDSSGEVFFCYASGKSVGNVKESSFRKVWNGSRANKTRRRLKGCKKCWQNCYLEPSIRMSLPYVFGNLLGFLKEIRKYL